MSIDEVMKFVERVSHYDPARPQDLSRLRAAIDQHVAEAVAREREEIAAICEEFGAWNKTASEILDAIYDRAGKGTKP